MRLNGRWKWLTSAQAKLLITSMDADGTKAGYDIALMRAINDRVTVPTIASGGVGNLQHLADGIIHGGADAVLAASIFHFGQHTIPEAESLYGSPRHWNAPLSEF